MGRLIRSNRFAPLSSLLLMTFLSGVIPCVRADAPSAPADGQRVPWTSSRFTGTPDPPLPYTVEVAFPSLRFDRPVLLAPCPGSERLFVAEMGGKVLSFLENPRSSHADLSLDLAKVRPDFTALYGLAFHPRFETNRQVFLCYVLKNGQPDGTRVSRFTMTRTDPPKIDPASEKVLITWLSGGHNGSDLAFGPDGYLYISAGDATDPSPPDSLATGQDVSDLLSSILRIDVDAQDPGKAYRVPPDNPLVPVPDARPEIWAYGFRNPWRMGFDRETGDLWVGDVGWELWELIYRVERGGNYGWSVMEGRQPIRKEGRRGPTPILPPTADHPHSEAASITGGYVYRGSRLNELVGTYVYGDYQSGRVWGLRHDGKRVTWRGELADTGLRLVAFGLGHERELYLVEHERSNQIYRLIPNPTPKAKHDFPKTLSQTGLFASTSDHIPAPGVIPYAINAEMWSDGARGDRLMAVPATARIDVDKEGNWKLPDGSVLARTVSLDLVAGDPKSRRRLETQVLHQEGGSWRPYTYIWDDQQADATLADAAGSVRTLNVRDDRAPGGSRQHAYRFAARSECILCHNPWVEARTTVFGRQSASPLAMSTAQLDRDGVGTASEEHQIRRLERLGYLSHPLKTAGLPRLVDPHDERADLDARARSYLQVNCAHCHQFNAGGAAYITLTSSLALEKTGTVDVRPVQGTFGIDEARIIAPGEPDRSVLYYRIAKTGAGRMPRIGSQRVDEGATRLFADWITRMPRPAAGGHAGPADAQVTEALATLRAAPESTSPAARAEAIRRQTATTRGALALVPPIDRGEIPGPTLREIVATMKDDPRVEVRDLFERFVPDDQRIARLGDAIDSEILLALPGDAKRGREYFFAESATQCKSCHRIAGVGVDLGPDLAEIGSKYTKRDLLRHLIEPSREVDPKYATHSVATQDGQVHIGLLVEKTESDLVLRDAQNKTIRIRGADIEERAIQSTSLMPEGLLRDLTAQQAADLLEYLASLKKP